MEDKKTIEFWKDGDYNARGGYFIRNNLKEFFGLKNWCFCKKVLSNPVLISFILPTTKIGSFRVDKLLAHLESSITGNEPW